MKRKGNRERRRTWRPALEEREVGFFLSLSLRLAGVLPVVKPFAPFPDMFSHKHFFLERERDLASEVVWSLLLCSPSRPFIYYSQKSKIFKLHFMSTKFGFISFNFPRDLENGLYLKNKKWLFVCLGNSHFSPWICNDRSF